MSRWLARWLGSCLLVAYYIINMATVVYAEPSPQSTNYRFDESVIDAGGLIQSSSTNFKTDSALGDVGIGNAASTNFQIEAGSKTTNDPALAFSVAGAADFGSFSSTTAATATSTFSVLNYTSYGYVVQIAGNPPTNGSHTITAMGTTGGSTTGTEQFGINLVANTSPVSFGANPDHGQFGFGAATTNYGTANQFRYVSGETIASAPKSSGLTTYTMSYIVNVTSLTPGGQYTSGQTLIVTGTY
jgi:hypothetical protein